MKKLIVFTVLVLWVLYFPLIGHAANSQTRGDHHEYATVDTAPGAGGYGTEEINPKNLRKKAQFNQIWFSIGGTGTMTVTLQFYRPDVEIGVWHDYADYTDTEYKLLEEGGTNIRWRAVVKQGAHSSGEKIFGFSW